MDGLDEMAAAAGCTCALCSDGAGAWIHRLDPARAQFRIFGKGHTWADRVTLCSRCERLYQDGDDDGLIAVQERTWQRSETDVNESLGNPLVAFRRADEGVVPLTEWWPPGVAELVAAGLVPLEELTGDLEIVRDWPESHRRSVPETRPGWAEDFWEDGRCWLVRSPWPSLPTREVVALLWRFVDQGRRSTAESVLDAQAQRERVRQFVHADEAWVLAFARQQRGRNW